MQNAFDHTGVHRQPFFRMVKNMTKSISLFFSLVGFSALCACGGDTGGPHDAATASDVQAACDAICSEDNRCDPDGPDENCMADCLEESAFYAGNVRADILDGLRACYADLTCEEPEDSCAERALESVGLSLEDVTKDADVQTCLAKQHECEGTADNFSDDMCLLLVFLVSSSRATAASCYQKSCTEIDACTAPVFGD